MAEQEGFLSKVPTTLSAGRMLFGAYQARDVVSSDIAERGWVDAGITAAAAVTDKLDGSLSRSYGSTEHGPFIDRLADVVFSEGGRLALAWNREISPVHSVIGLGREVIVQALRQTAKGNGEEIAVASRGQQKTTANMLLMVAARSPLARHKDLKESLASAGSALSIMSGVGYGQEWLVGRRKIKNPHEMTDTARNGGLRKASASPNNRIARFIDERLPNVTPDHLTTTGETLVEASAALTLLKPELATILAIGPYTLGGLIDGLDGNLARIKGETSLEGMLKDVRADKRQEIITAAANCILAKKQGNKVAARQFALAAATASLPAYFRAASEANGHLVSEDASGSRVIRGIEGGVGLGLHTKPGAANISSALMVVGNVITAAQRADVARNGSSSPHFRGDNTDPESIINGMARRDALLPFALGGVAVGTLLELWLEKSS